LATPTTDDDAALANASEGEDEAQIADIRVNNAYTGATNSIGSVHQRHWFLQLDRARSGFVQVKQGKEKGKWARGNGGRGGFEPFYVRGAEVERSVVTGRLSREVMEDEGVEGFVGRKMWRPILE